MKDRERYYKILGLETTATPEEIKKAYRSLAKQWHPDRFIDRPQMLAKAQQEIKKINQAYAILKDYRPEKTVSSVSSNQVIKTPKNAAEIHYQRGVEFAEAEAYEAAIAEFTHTIKIDRQYIKAYQYRGFILSKLGYELRANNDFRTVDSLKSWQNKKASGKKRNYSYSNNYSKKNHRYRRKTHKSIVNKKLVIFLFLLLSVIALTILFR